MSNYIIYSCPGEVHDGFPSGKLGNMAGGFPFDALGRTWKSSEHLYLLGWWSDSDTVNIAIQEDVLSAKSGFAAKRFKKAKYKRFCRPDFVNWRHDWMIWVVWQKCIGNAEFRDLLLSTGDATIVEVVKNDPVWAAWLDEKGNYIGANGMGRILMACREALRTNTVPTIDSDKLNAANIWILGQKLQF